MKKVHIIAMIMVFGFCITACGKGSSSDEGSKSGGGKSEEESIEFDIKEYKKLVSQCYEDIKIESTFLSTMGLYQGNYWNASNNIGGRIDYDKLVSNAFDYIEEEGESDKKTIEMNYQNINKQYKEILIKDISGTEAEEIKTSFKELYNTFNSLYLLITSPSGDINDFADDYATYTNEIEAHDSTLSLLLSDEEGK